MSLLAAAIALLAAGPVAVAAPSAPSAPPAADHRTAPGPHDGVTLSIGPLFAATRVDDDWTTGAGLEVSLVHVEEAGPVPSWGVAAGGLGYTEREGGRFWLEGQAALHRPLPFPVGLGLGAAAEVDRVRPARFGAEATLWLFLGVVPYLRAGALAEIGTFVEMGIMLKLPTLRWE